MIMRVHPNITIQYSTLRRLPHIFSKILELPFHSNAKVTIEETVESFRFVVGTDDVVSGEVSADTVEIFPGITKVVIRGTQFEELEIDTWRFRLPEGTRPELATAEYGEGELAVTVPKGMIVLLQ